MPDEFGVKEGKIQRRSVLQVERHLDPHSSAAGTEGRCLFPARKRLVRSVRMGEPLPL